jgi:hypothetical protein
VYCSSKTVLAAGIVAAVFTLSWNSDIEACGRLRQRRACCAENCGIPWYAFCYSAGSSKATGAFANTSCNSPPPAPNNNYVAWCCYNAAWSKADDLPHGNSDCQGKCYWLAQNTTPQQAGLGSCGRKPCLPCAVRSCCDCICAFVVDDCTGKIRFAYPCEYNIAGNPKVFYTSVCDEGTRCAPCSR